MTYSLLIATADDGSEVAVATIEYDTGLIRLLPKSELNRFPTYSTSDGQDYWALKTKLPDKIDFTDGIPVAGSSESSILVGYIRRSNDGNDLKISINVSALDDVAENHNDPSFGAITLGFSKPALAKVVKGERAVTTVLSTEGVFMLFHHDAINRKSIFDRKA